MVSRNVVGIKLDDFCTQLVFLVRIIEVRSVGPIQAVKWEHRQQLDVVFHLASRQRPQLLQAIRISDDRWPGIERKAVFDPVIGTAAGFIPRFDDCRFDACRLQADGKCEAAKTGPDHNCALHAFSRRTLSASRIGTGGLPANIRALSINVVDPA